MPPMKRSRSPSNPRDAAWRALSDYDTRHPPWDGLFRRALKGLQGPDRGLAAELLVGTLRHRRLIDSVALAALGREESAASPSVWNMIRMGVYQLLFLDRVPAHAAVNEAVEGIKSQAPRAAGLVNAALRAVAREMEHRDLLAGHPLAVRHSLPDEIAEAICAQLPPEEHEQAFAAMNDPGPLGLRLNSLVAPPDATKARVEEFIGTSLAAHSLVPGAWMCDRSHLDALLPLLDEGAIVVQDPASQLVAHLIAPTPGLRIVDLCAAPGGKSAHLADMMGNDGVILATDRDRQRLAAAEENLVRLGATCVETMDWGMSEVLMAAPEPDVILVDAPCSSWGTARHQPDVKWREHEYNAQAVRQLSLLERAAPHLSPGGVLVYSVCTLLPAETAEVVQSFLATDDRFELQDAREVLPLEAHSAVTECGIVQTWPHRHGCDGFFAVRLIRR